MKTNLNESKRYLRAGYILRNRGMGWSLELPRGTKPPSWQMAESLKVHTDMVALLSAQGCIKTELRVAGSATWIPEPVRVGVAL